ncbi:MAG: 3-keto-disaccharide hydrolase [Verrucomicrobiales bacterium]
MTKTIFQLGFAAALTLAIHGTTNIYAAELQNGSWEVLFDGKSTQKWRGFKKDKFPSESWKVEDGSLRTIVGNGTDIVTKEKYDNFELQLEWKVTPGANSGIMFRVSEEMDQAWHTGPELQVLDDAKHADGKNPKTSAGSLYALIAPKGKELKPVGEWNQMKLIINGNHGEHWLNGKKVVEYELNSKELNELIAKSKFASMPRFAKEKTGHIVLQHHHDEVWFRNVKIRRLSGNGSVPEKQP